MGRTDGDDSSSGEDHDEKWVTALRNGDVVFSSSGSRAGPTNKVGDALLHSLLKSRSLKYRATGLHSEKDKIAREIVAALRAEQARFLIRVDPDVALEKGVPVGVKVWRHLSEKSVLRKVKRMLCLKGKQAVSKLAGAGSMGSHAGRTTLLVTSLRKADVILEKDRKSTTDHEGNAFFNGILSRWKSDYNKATSRKVKEAIACRIIETVKFKNGRFLLKADSVDTEMMDEPASVWRQISDGTMVQIVPRLLQECSENGEASVHEIETVTSLRETDVVFGRGRPVNMLAGNVMYRNLIREKKPEYLAAESEEAKIEIACQIIDTIKTKDGRFLIIKPHPKDELDVWITMSDESVLFKVRQALFDLCVEKPESDKPISGHEPVLPADRQSASGLSIMDHLQATYHRSGTHQRQRDEEYQRDIEGLRSQGNLLGQALMEPPAMLRRSISAANSTNGHHNQAYHNRSGERYDRVPANGPRHLAPPLPRPNVPYLSVERLTPQQVEYAVQRCIDQARVEMMRNRNVLPRTNIQSVSEEMAYTAIRRAWQGDMVSATIRRAWDSWNPTSC